MAIPTIGPTTAPAIQAFDDDGLFSLVFPPTIVDDVVDPSAEFV
jgi:hypothetical protein